MARDPANRQKFIDALEGMVAAMAELNYAWDQLPDDDDTMDAVTKGYPFHLSFDELAVNVAAWRDSVKKRMFRGPKDWRPRRK